MARIKAALCRLLDMAVTLRALHFEENNIGDVDRTTMLTKLETDFIKTSQFLQTVLGQMTKLAKLPFGMF